MVLHHLEYYEQTQNKSEKIRKLFVFSEFNQSLEVGVIQLMLGTHKKYNACRSFIFIENDLVNLKLMQPKTLIEQDAARIIFKTLVAINKRHKFKR